MKTASPSFCSKVHGSIPIKLYQVKKKEQEKFSMEKEKLHQLIVLVANQDFVRFIYVHNRRIYKVYEGFARQM